MKQNKIKIFWFTLIELMVVITIIWILALWISNVNFRAMSDGQKLKTYTNNIINNIETIRNNALMWKWVTSDLIVPPSWKIDFGFSWSWSISTFYSWATWVPYSEFDTNFSDYYSIDSIRCLTLDWTEDNNLSVWEVWSVYIKQNILDLSWDCLDTSKILEITTAYKWFTNKFSVNTVNWLVEKDY